MQIGCDLPGAAVGGRAPRRAHDALVAGVALHPNEAPRLAAAGGWTRRWPRSSAWRTAHDKVRAVGETGLDHFRTGPEGRAAQVESFRRHIDLAKRLDKTLVIHDRDAHDEVLEVIDERGRARALGDALLLRRRRASPGPASTAALPVASPAR